MYDTSNYVAPKVLDLTYLLVAVDTNIFILMCISK